MSIRYVKGDMFAAQTEAIVNTVNCVGVMGKGVALEFKKRWPDNFKAYKRACDAKELRPGMMLIEPTGDMFSESPLRYLINFPTKDHWRSKSKLSYVEDGLDAFVEAIKQQNIKSVALPPLGCGNGGLDWSDVCPLIEEKLSALDGVDIVVYAPKEHNFAPEHIAPPIKWTLPRAMMVKTFGEIEKYFDGYLTRISAQKTVYFLQVLGVDFSLEFARNKNGPYSEKLKDIFKNLEKQNYIEGFSQQDPEIRATQSAFAAASDYLATEEATESDAIIHKLALLIEGYESPYGMELLSSVHYLAAHENLQDIDAIIDGFKNWNDHKQTNFPEKSIRAAYERLKEDGLLH